MNEPTLSQFVIQCGLVWQRILEIPEQRVRIGSRGNLSFHVYNEDKRGGHHYPHFHVRACGKEASVIYEGENIRVIGVLDRRLQKIAVDWANDNRERVMRVYTELNGSFTTPIM